MVKKLDDSVGEVVAALQRKGMLENSIIVFTSDNGAPTGTEIYPNWGSNYPFRGVSIIIFLIWLRFCVCLFEFEVICISQDIKKNLKYLELKVRRSIIHVAKKALFGNQTQHQISIKTEK